MDEPITYAEAANLLPCVVSNVPKLIAKGHLTVHREPGRIRGHLLRTDVEQVAQQRAAAADQPKPRGLPSSVLGRPSATNG